MSRPVKCPACGQSFDRDVMESVAYGGRFYHKQCYKMAVEDKDKLYAYLRELFGQNLNMALVNKQIKGFIEDQGYTYSGIMGTLVYAFDVKGLDKGKSRGVGIVPYLYNEARDYYMKIAVAKQQNENVEIKKITETVEIVSPQCKPTRNYRPIDIEKILGGLEDNE